MNKFLTAVALAAAILSSAAHAGQFDTSKLTVQNKNFLVVGISEHKALCDVEQSPLIKSLYKQLLSEIDIQSTSMDGVRQDAANALEKNGKAAWCADMNAALKKIDDKIQGKVEAPATYSQPELAMHPLRDKITTPYKAKAIASLMGIIILTNFVAAGEGKAQARRSSGQVQ